jgi:hypothetical protein
MRTARSLIGFGIYVLLTGAFLAIAPNTLLGLLLTKPTSEHWIRLLGLSATMLGSYYIVAGRHNITAIARASVWARTVMIVGFTTLVVLRIAPLLLLGIAGNEAAGVLWTMWALRADARDTDASATA